MKMYLKKYVDSFKAEPIFFTLGICIVLLSVMGTSVRHVSSAMFAILVLLSFTVIKDWGRMYHSLTKLEKVFLLSFLLYTISGVLSYYNVDDADKYYKIFERYLRFTLVIPVYFLLIKKNRSLLKYLYAGAVISGPFMFSIALQHYLENPDMPAKGYYHHIIFGQLAMLNFGIMLSLLLSKNLGRQLQFLIAVSMVLGLVAAVMSQARGVWLVLPLYLVIAIYFVVKESRLSAKGIVVVLVSVVVLSLLTPVGSLLQNRTEQAVTEVSSYYNDDLYVSSVGTRLAMWEIALHVWRQYPVLGTGPGDFDDEVIALQQKGEYAGMEVHNSVHNIYLQALVGSGVVGLMALIFAVVIMPLRLFFNRDSYDREGSLAGFITIISFVVFGFSESWILRLPAVSIFLVYMVVIASHVHIVSRKNFRSRKEEIGFGES